MWNRPILVYIGKQFDMSGNGFPLWNIYNSPRPDLHPNGSTISTESLREMEMIR